MPDEDGRFQVTVNDASETVIITEPNPPKPVQVRGEKTNATTDQTASDSSQG